jgi:nitrogen fixation-related uncharacterized protein
MSGVAEVLGAIFGVAFFWAMPIGWIVLTVTA